MNRAAVVEFDAFCNFCHAFRQGEDPGMTAEYLNYCGSNAPSRTISAHAESVAFVALGPLCPGNVMVAPRRHYRSVMELLQMPDSQAFLSHLESVQFLVSQVYGPVTVFEHGMSIEREDENESCIDHAHLQIVPGEINLVRSMERDLGPALKLGALSAIVQGIRTPYLLATEPGGQDYFVFPGMTVPSQYLRRLISAARGQDQWNWRGFPSCDEVVRTHGTIEAYISKLRTRAAQLESGEL